MTTHSFNVSVGDQVFVGDRVEEVGAVRMVAKDHIVIYVEGSGDFRISGVMVKSAHDAKLVLDPDHLDARLLDAIKKAHELETE